MADPPRAHRWYTCGARRGRRRGGGRACRSEAGWCRPGPVGRPADTGCIGHEIRAMRKEAGTVPGRRQARGRVYDLVLTRLQIARGLLELLDRVAEVHFG